MLLDAPLDDKTKHFGIAGEKALEVKTSFNKKRREKKIEKMSAYVQDVLYKIDTQLGSKSIQAAKLEEVGTAKVKKPQVHISPITSDSDLEDNEPLAFRRVQRKNVLKPPVEQKKAELRRRLVRKVTKPTTPPPPARKPMQKRKPVTLTTTSKK